MHSGLCHIAPHYWEDLSLFTGRRPEDGDPPRVQHADVHATGTYSTQDSELGQPLCYSPVHTGGGRVLVHRARLLS